MTRGPKTDEEKTRLRQNILITVLVLMTLILLAVTFSNLILPQFRQGNNSSESSTEAAVQNIETSALVIGLGPNLASGKTAE